MIRYSPMYESGKALSRKRRKLTPVRPGLQLRAEENIGSFQGRFNPKTAVGHLGTLRLPQKLRRSGRTDSHPTGDHFGTSFVLRLSKHEQARGAVTAVFRCKVLSARETAFIRFEIEFGIEKRWNSHSCGKMPERSG